MPAVDSTGPRTLSYLPRPASGRLRQVWLTYAGRPLFRALAVATVGWCLLLIWHQRNNSVFFRGSHWVLDFFAELLFGVSPLVLLVATVASLMGHVREQIQDWRGCLTPGFRGPHLAVAALVFLATAVAGTAGLYAVSEGPHGNGTTSLSGLLAVVLTAMTIAAWWASFRSPWVSLLLAPLLLLALNFPHFNELLLWFVSDWLKSQIKPAVWWVYRDLNVRKEVIRAYVLVGDVVALWALMRRLARMGPEPFAPVRALRTRGAVVQSSAPVLAGSRRRHAVSGLWARAWQRRLAVLRPGAPWLVAALLCAILLLLTLVIGPKDSDELRSCVLATILPGITVGVAWLERWPALGYESLFPATRRRFAAEMALAMAADVAEFWPATTLAVMVPIAVWHSASLTSPLLPATILASAMMQFLMIGGMYWAMIWRNRAAYFAILGAIVLAFAIPLEMAWAPRHALSEYQLLQIAFAEMACGLILGLAGFAAWRRGELT